MGWCLLISFEQLSYLGAFSYVGVVYLLYMLYFKMSCVYCC